ncbi:MAG TPA: E3 binding domain-containing protein [Dermatophilaceae bacterium]
MSERAAYATPLVRRLASDNNVDLNLIKGTDSSARIRKQDVLDAAAAAKTAAAPAVTTAPAPAEAPALGRVSEVEQLRGVMLRL